MSTLALTTGTVAVLVVLVVFNLFAIFFGLSFLRASRAVRTAAETEAASPVAPSKPVKVVSRRDFFRRSLITSVLVFGAEFGGGTIAFLWPSLTRGFGARISAGSLSDIKAAIATDGQVYNGAGRFYLVPWNGQTNEEADYVAMQTTAEGVMALYQRCVHLGCRVPFCGSSKWFECPCHGSKYNQAGEYKLGPAPRGMDRFRISIEGDQVIVDTGQVVLGPPRGVDTISQPPQGPYCVATG